MTIDSKDQKTSLKYRSPTAVAVLAGVLALAPVYSLAKGSSGASGGRSQSHISSQGLANTNGPDSTDRDFGRDRSSDRMSASGLAHSRSGSSSINSGGSTHAIAHRWLHGRHHHYGWRA